MYDDRSVSAGVMFSDADLLGVPLRVIVSPRNMRENCCELASRDKSFNIKIPLDGVLQAVKEKISSFAGR
jgi:prolyl-tRNA synthetase